VTVVLGGIISVTIESCKDHSFENVGSHGYHYEYAWHESWCDLVESERQAQGSDF